MGTGIVFVVLVAIWVAYFVQYWSRRREHLATARSVEAFADAMRVLERRPALRARAGHRVSSAYAMSPARVVSARPAPRPRVIAKPHPTTPSPSRGGAPRMSTPTTPRPSPQRTTRVRPRAATSPDRQSPGRRPPSRKVRGLTLLGSLVATLGIAILAAFSILLWWVPVVGVAAVGASLLWLRSGVQAEIAARSVPRGRRPVQRRVARPSAAAARVDQAGVSAEDHEVSAAPAGASEPELIETTSVTAADEARPDRWQPVPVPPPTYTLKAKAERPAPPVPEVADVAPSTPAATDGEPDAGRAAAFGT